MIEERRRNRKSRTRSTRSPAREDLYAKLVAIVDRAVEQVMGGGGGGNFDCGRSNNKNDSSISVWDPDSSTARSRGYDIEIRTATAIFHRHKQKRRAPTTTIQQPTGPKEAVFESIHHEVAESSSSSSDDAILTTVSDMGVTRIFASPYEFASYLLPTIEDGLRETTTTSMSPCDHVVRVAPQGFVTAVSAATVSAANDIADNNNVYCCPRCPVVCKNEKGLWWHLQEYHTMQHNVAVLETAAAASSRSNPFALVVYNGGERGVSLVPEETTTTTAECATVTVANSAIENDGDTAVDPWSCVKSGDLQRLQQQMLLSSSCRQIVVQQTRDHHGASLLHWAAGGGWLAVVRYLVEDCGYDADLAQTGKRAFAGRTALHWAARNGHLNVVQYLLPSSSNNVGGMRKARMEACTIDETTAFCWAAWQRHLDVMQYLHSVGCNIETTNKYGCNAVLWAAQGKGDASLVGWLESVGCLSNVRNHSGHGVLHKAAQRGNFELCKWFVEERLCVWVSSLTGASLLDLIGPDNDGCVPSDLAGMEGHVDLAIYLTDQEQKLVQAVVTMNNSLPSWLTPIPGSHEYNHDDWEPWAGVYRMRSILPRSCG
jgi:Ankyrin repeats (3 copies)